MHMMVKESINFNCNEATTSNRIELVERLNEKEVMRYKYYQNITQ